MTEKKPKPEDAARSLLNRLAALNLYTGEAERDPELAVTGMEDAELADATALLQELRHRLGLVERTLTVELGKRMGKGTGALSDGRMFTMARSTDRKEWDHDDWKRDARRAVTAVITEKYGDHLTLLVEDGEVVDLPLGRVIQEALGMAQAVHGAQAPKSTELKKLGLHATDYCASVPSGWRFTAVKPHATTDTETPKDTTDD